MIISVRNGGSPRLGCSCSLSTRKIDKEKQKMEVKLKAVDATPANFKEFGQVVGPSADGAPFGPSDAQLQLHRGIPRFYIMHLEDRALCFDRITHHASVTQCLGSVGGKPWYLGVARPSILQTEELESYKVNGIEEASQDNADSKNTQKYRKRSKQGNTFLSKAGHYYVPPAPEDVQVFRVQGPQFLKLHVGTWHAGPLFKEASMDFYNLELTDTNVVDHTTHVFSEKDGLAFVIEE